MDASPITFQAELNIITILQSHLKNFSLLLATELYCRFTFLCSGQKHCSTGCHGDARRCEALCCLGGFSVIIIALLFQVSTGKDREGHLDYLLEEVPRAASQLCDYVK